MTATDRQALVQRALFIEKMSIAWMLVEGSVAVASGFLAHSVALVAFGFDSALELVAAVVVYVRLRGELRQTSQPHREPIKRFRDRFALG